VHQTVTGLRGGSFNQNILSPAFKIMFLSYAFPHGPAYMSLGFNEGGIPMKRAIGIICLAVALGGLGWKLVAAALTIDDSKMVNSETQYDSQGQIIEQKRTAVKMLTFTRLKVNEGAELLVTADGLELKNAGRMTVDEPILSQVNELTWWAMLMANLVAGLYLMGISKKERPAGL